MAKKRIGARRGGPKKTAKPPRPGRRVAAATCLLLCAALATITLARRGATPTPTLAASSGAPPVAPAQAQGGGLALTKEYIYAGGRLVATEEPSPSPPPCKPSSSVSVIISEFRFRGPQGSGDEFVELYNNTDAQLSVCASDGSTGWALATRASDGSPALLETIPNGTVVPARGHYLTVGSNYSLGPSANSAGFAAPSPPDTSFIVNALRHPVQIPVFAGLLMDSGNTFVGGLTQSLDANSAAARQAASAVVMVGGDSRFAADVADDSGVALFSTSDPANFTTQTRLDAAGFNNMAGTNADLYREGAGLPPVSDDGEYSFVRKTPTASGLPQDTNDNASDFAFVSTSGGTYSGVVSELGAPGPENSSDPVLWIAPTSLFDPAASQSSAPNRVYCGTCAWNNDAGTHNGTLTIRRTITNNTGHTISRLRFRVIDLTTLNSPGYVAGGSQADLRVLSSADETVTRGDGSSAAVKGTTVETPPDQPSGGGLNTALDVALGDGGLAAGQSISFQLLLGVQQGGSFHIYVNAEALP
jgi:hypothetical protein